MTSNHLNPQIYVACLAAYNSGKLHGAWIDANQDADDIKAEIDRMLKSSPEPDAEEWAIHTYEDFGGLELDEYESIDQVAMFAQLIAEHGPAFAAYVAHKGKEYATAESFQEDYCGESESEADFAENHYSESTEIPEHLARYIDWERVANDLFVDDYFSSTSEGSTYVFRRS